MFFITCFSKCEKDELGWFDGGASRTFGYYDNFEDCKRALNENWCDMHEFLYLYAVVEKIDQGIHAIAEDEVWFKWDEKRQGFFEISKPECANGFTNHAIG